MNTSSLIVAAALVLLPGAAVAQSAPPEAPPYQVVRLGDGQMSCEALVAEISSLTAEMDRMQREMMTRSMAMGEQASQGLGGLGGGAAMSLGSLAASFIPGADMLMGSVAAAAGEALMERQREQMMKEAESMASEGMAMMPMSQRMEHLAELSRSRSC